MAFEQVQIRSVRNGLEPVIGWRQDLDEGDSIALALTDYTGVSSLQWWMVGRPEGSGAGGPGPEPIDLGTATTAVFTCDSDLSLFLDGTYIVHCVVNGGSPTETAIRAGFARMAAGLVDENGLPLRLLGPFEVEEDTHERLVKQGWAKMLNRWLRALKKLMSQGVAADHKVAIDISDNVAGGADYAETKFGGDGTTTTTTVETGTHGKKMVFHAIIPSPPAPDDHLVKARTADATTVGGLMEKTTDSDTVTRELVTESGQEKVKLHATLVPPPVAGSWLYTGMVPAALLLDPAVSFVKSLDGMGGLSPGQAELFEVVSDGVYRHKVAGQLYGLDPTGVEAFALSLGDRVWLTTWQDVANQVHGGLCTVTTLGNGSTKAVLTKTADVIVVGSTFLVNGAGAEFQGWYWEIDPDLTNPFPLTYKPTYQDTTTHNLYTDAQLYQASGTVHEMVADVPAGGGDVAFPIVFPTFDGTPSASVIPKGQVVYEVAVYLTADNPAAMTYLHAALGLNSSGPWFADAFSYPMRNTAPQVIGFVGTIPSDIAADPSNKLWLKLWAISDSASAVRVHILYSTPTHQTRVRTTLDMPSYGALDDHKVSLNADANAASAWKYLADAINPEDPLVARENDATHQLDFSINTATGLTVGAVKLGTNPGLSASVDGDCGDLNDPTASQAKHRHAQADPAETGSYLYPCKRVSPNAPTITGAPVVTAVSDVVVTWNYTRWSGEHGNNIIDTVYTFPNDPNLYLIGVTVHLTTPFNGTGQTQFYLNDCVAETEDTYKRCIPTYAERGTYPLGFDLHSETSGAEHDAPASLSFRCSPPGVVGALVVELTSHGCLLEQLTAGQITFTLHFEQRAPVNSETVNATAFTAGHSADTSTTIDLTCPIAPAPGLVLTGLRLIVDQVWSVGTAGGSLTLAISGADGAIVFSPVGIRDVYEDVEWELSGLSIPLSSNLRATLARGAGALGDVSSGRLLVEYTVEQVTEVAPSVVGYNLLTGAEATSNDVAPFALDQAVAASGETLVGELFITLDGMPATIPAAPIEFGVLGNLNVVDLSKVRKWRVKFSILREGEGTPDSPFLVVDGPALYNATAALAVFSGTPSAPVTVGALDKPCISYYAVTPDASPVTFTLQQNESLSSYVKLSFGIAGSYGTLDHKKLTMTSRGFVAGEEADAAAYAHPELAIAPGWRSTPATSIAVVDNVLPILTGTPRATSNIVHVTGTGPLSWIESAGLSNGDQLILFFLAAMTVTNVAAEDSRGSSIAFGTLGMGNDPAPQDVDFTLYSSLYLSLEGGTWRPVAPWFINQTD